MEEDVTEAASPFNIVILLILDSIDFGDLHRTFDKELSSDD